MLTMKNKEVSRQLIRVALYVRVSGEEQKIKGSLRHGTAGTFKGVCS